MFRIAFVFIFLVSTLACSADTCRQIWAEATISGSATTCTDRLARAVDAFAASGAKVYRSGDKDSPFHLENRDVKWLGMVRESDHRALLLITAPSEDTKRVKVVLDGMESAFDGETRERMPIFSDGFLLVPLPHESQTQLVLFGIAGGETPAQRPYGVLLFDDFELGASVGWAKWAGVSPDVTSPGNHIASLRAGGLQADVGMLPASLGEYEISFRLRVTGDGTLAVGYGVDASAQIHSLALKANKGRWVSGAREIPMIDVEWHRMTVRVIGARADVLIDGRRLATRITQGLRPVLEVHGGCEIDDVILRGLREVRDWSVRTLGTRSSRRSE